MAGSLPDIPNFAVRVTQPVFPLTAWDRILSVTCCLADFLASCAMIVSLGLLIATWVRRLGQAVALSVIAYFLTAFGWFLLVVLVLDQIVRSQSADWYNEHLWLERTAMSFSPIYGTMNSIAALEWYAFQGRLPIWISFGFVILVKAAIAGLLFWLTIKTFDRCLGRVSESRFHQSINSRYY